MKNIIYLAWISLFIVYSNIAFADSYKTEAEKNVVAYIDEDFFGDGGTMIINNNSVQTVRVMLLKATPSPYNRGQVTLEQYKIVTIHSGKTIECNLHDIANTIHGIGVINESKNKPYHIHGFEWPD